MHRTLTKWLILIALLAYAVLVSAWASSTVQKRHCTGIEVDIKPAAPGVPSVLKPQAVLSELGPLAKNYGKIALYDINTDSLENILNKVNNFEQVEVVRTSQGKLLITVVPMIPEARVFSSLDSYYINKDGKRMDATAEYFVDLPIVRGNFTRKMPASGVLPVVRYIKEHNELTDLITMIDYKSTHNIYLVPRIRGHIINLGDTSDLDEKFDKLMLMYRKVMPYKGWNMYDTISLKFKNQIVATRADKSIIKHNNVDLSEIVDYEEQALASDGTDQPAPEAPKPSSENSSEVSPSTN